MTPVPRPEHQRPRARRAVRTGELHVTAGRHIGVDRKRARPYDGHQATHRLGSLPAIGAKRGEEGSFTFQTGQQDPGPPAGSQAATSSKSTAGHPAEMLRKSGRQQQSAFANRSYKRSSALSAM